jgi:hypothetical protein
MQEGIRTWPFSIGIEMRLIGVRCSARRVVTT